MKTLGLMTLLFLYTPHAYGADYDNRDNTQEVTSEKVNKEVNTKEEELKQAKNIGMEDDSRVPASVEDNKIFEQHYLHYY